MPDKLMTPEEFARHLNGLSRFATVPDVIELITARDESIQREAKREEHISICWTCYYPQQRHLCKRYLELAGLPIDTPPAAESLPNASTPSWKPFIQEMAEHKITPDELAESDIRPAAERAGDAVCPTCKGYPFKPPCPDCHGTGKAAASGQQEFCRSCGAGIGKFRREHEGTCDRCVNL